MLNMGILTKVLKLLKKSFNCFIKDYSTLRSNFFKIKQQTFYFYYYIQNPFRPKR